MINRQLIAAERANRASQGFVDQGNVVQQGMLESVNLIRQDVARQTAKKNAANQKVASYINQLNSDVDLTSLTETQQQSVNNFLVNGRNEYADIAVRLSKMDDPSSPQYMEDKNRLNSISRSFQNLSSQVKNYKNDKISYLKDFDESLLSDGNKADTVENAASVYTNEADFAVNQSGGLMIWDNNNEDYKGYGEIEKPFLKDFQSADKILSMNEGIYKRGQELTGANETLTRQKLKQMVNKGGRDTLLSLASDDFMMEGGLGLQDPALFEPGNEAALSNAVVDGYMNVLKDSASQGAKERGTTSSKRSSGFSGSLKDELAVSGGIQNDAINFSRIGVKVPDSQRQAKSQKIVSVLNSIDASEAGDYVSRGEAYNMFLTSQEIEDSPESRDDFTSEYGDNQIYLYDKDDVVGIDVDTDNPKDLNKLYLQSAGLSNKATNYYIGQYNGGNKTKTNNSANTAQELINKYRKQ